MNKKNLLYGLGALVVLFVLGELTLFLPAFNPSNPPVTNEIVWDSPQTEALFTQACADCHSNETVYPWYSYVVPVAWLVNHDVQEGREYVNVSVGRYPDEMDEMEELVMEGEMPPANYITMHPNAALTDEQKTLLVTGLQTSFAASPSTGTSSGGEAGEGGGDGDSDGD